jgi:hypothetical protein
MTERQILIAAHAWLEGWSTYDIAKRLRLPEQQVATATNMARIKARVAFLKRERSALVGWRWA